MGCRKRFALAGVMVAACPLVAQDTLTTGSVGGRVADGSGAAIAGARVRVVELATNAGRDAVTNVQGHYRVPFLPAGRYVLRVEAAGFAEQQRMLEVSAGSAFDVSVALALAGVSTTVEVAGNAPVVEGERSQVAQTVGEQEAANLPFQGRNYLDLALLLPGVSPTNTASVQTFAETSPVAGQGYSVNSQRNFSNGFVVDGLSANDDAAGLAGNVYGLDVIREFQVVTSGGQAEFGRALGGYFNLVTKSGGNDVHGDAYGFLRNQRLNAANALTRGTLPLTQGQYGASVGGPLRRDRTFGYANFEQKRLNTDGILTIAPTNAAAINARLVAVGYRAPLLTVGAGPTTLFPTTVHTTTGFGRLDQRFGSADALTVRYSNYRLDALNARGAGSLSAVSYGTAVRDVNHTVAVSNVVTVSPRVFNETRGQWTSDRLDAPPNDAMGPAVNIAGVAFFGRFSTSPVARYNDLYELVDNVVAERGAHTLKGGVDFLLNRDTIVSPQQVRGVYVFSSLANFLSGRYNTQGYTQAFGAPAVAQNNPNVGVYLQDEWKATPRLTVNAGVRYDLQWLRTIATDTNNVSPRVGLAWAPTRDGRMVVRASYGLYFDRVPLRALANALLSAGNTTNFAQAQLLSYTFSPGDAGAPVFPHVATAAPPVGVLVNYTVMNRHMQNAVAQQASVEVEQQVGPRSSVAVSYQHLRGEHLLLTANNNTNPDGSRPNPTLGNVRAYDSRGDSYYDGLAVSVVQRPTRFLSARLSYTWSKAIDDVGEFFFSAPVNNFNVGEDRSRSDDDQRHRVVVDAVVHSSADPARGALQRVTHGWQLGGILQYYSRLPFNVLTGTTTLQGTTQRPCAAGYSLGAGGGVNPCTEGLPGALIGRNAGVGFAFFGMSGRLSRTFPLREGVRLETIAEAFNALNHRNDMIPNGTFGTGAYPAAPAATFGQATAVGDPRSVELALRLTF